MQVSDCHCFPHVKERRRLLRSEDYVLFTHRHSQPLGRILVCFSGLLLGVIAELFDCALSRDHSRFHQFGVAAAQLLARLELRCPARNINSTHGRCPPFELSRWFLIAVVPALSTAILRGHTPPPIALLSPHT